MLCENLLQLANATEGPPPDNWRKWLSWILKLLRLEVYLAWRATFFEPKPGSRDVLDMIEVHRWLVFGSQAPSSSTEPPQRPLNRLNLPLWTRRITSLMATTTNTHTLHFPGWLVVQSSASRNNPLIAYLLGDTPPK